LDGIWLKVIASLLGAVSIVLTYYGRKVANWIIAKMKANDYEKEAMNRLLDGMSLAQESLIRQAKLDAADGKLTKEEIKQAEAMALEYAKDIAAGPVLDIIKSWTERRVSSLIKQLLSKFKGGKDGKSVAKPAAPVINPAALGATE